MKFTLKPYQAEAVDNLLDMITRAKEIYDVEATPTSTSLSATTGAGKTVMAAAVLEALFYGSDTFNFDPDPGATVIWFSDDPNLNEQTRFRLMQASDKLTWSDLIPIQPPFAQSELDAGKVYFLNTGKLTKTSLLTRGHADVDVDEVLPGMHRSVSPDMQGWTIWETIANTINNPNKTLILILDEAHQGFNSRTNRDKPTIVRKLVNGHAGYPPIPIVWGISATIQRFKDAMDQADASQNRRALPVVTVDGFQVQESGLIKDTVVLEIPAETGNLDTVLVRRAATKLKNASERWHAYSQSQSLQDEVVPLLILQTPNTPDADQIGAALDVISEVMGDLPNAAIRHVFGDHTVQTFGSWEVDWIEPQIVEESIHVRVLVAKDAISTGWDCPRAEVLVSFRPAKDQTHITQLLGRMVRNPLARRIPGDEVLNSVECILPFFDRTTAANVVRYLTGQIEEVPGGNSRKVIIQECLLNPNPAIPPTVWDAWDKVPTQSIPQRGAAPIKQLVSLAHELAKSGVLEGAVSNVEKSLHATLDAALGEFEQQMKVAAAEVWAVHGQTISAGMGKKTLKYEDFVERADDRAIRAAFELARKAFGSDVAEGYVNHLAGPDLPDVDDDGLRDAYIITAALATVSGVRERIDLSSKSLVKELLETHRVAIQKLTDTQQSEFDSIKSLSVEPVEGNLGRPRTRIEDYLFLDKDGLPVVASLVEKHLMSDINGQFPVSSLNAWELEVVTKELSQHDCLAWHRNPPRQGTDSLGIAYRGDTGNWRSMHPDFIFFTQVGNDVKPSIIDPHGHYLEDTLSKLQALAQFAAAYGDRFHRIEALSKVDNSWKLLDLQQEKVRDYIMATTQPPAEIYASNIAMEYI